MNYKEILELYKYGKLDEEQKVQVEYDIEKQDAISQYLFDQEENDEFIEFEGESSTDDSEENVDAELFKKIRKSIRRTFICCGVVTAVIATAIASFLIYGLPKIEEKRYYNPTEQIKYPHQENDEESNTNDRLGTDIAVYTELFIPNNYRSSARAYSNGGGNYDFVIKQTCSFDGEFRDVAGTINKGKLRLYDTNLFNLPASNSFAPSDEMVFDQFENMNHDDYKEYLDDLKEDTYYDAYVTLDNVYTYDQLIDITKNYNVDVSWIAVCSKNDSGTMETPYICGIERMGFLACTDGSLHYYDAEKYPNMDILDLEKKDLIEGTMMPTKKAMKTHMTSVMNYFLNNEQAFKTIVDNEYESKKDIVEDYARSLKKDDEIYIYGFMTQGTKEEIKKLSNEAKVSYISTEEAD